MRRKYLLYIIMCSLAIFLGIWYTKVPKEFELNNTQIEEYNKYVPPTEIINSLDDLKMLCEEIKIESIGDEKCTYYNSDQLINYLYDCQEIIEIIEYGNCMIITYRTNNNYIIYLTYHQNGLSRLEIYDTKKDTFVAISNKKGTLYKNFTHSA